jgi:hypothetical protein
MVYFSNACIKAEFSHTPQLLHRRGAASYACGKFGACLTTHVVHALNAIHGTGKPGEEGEPGEPGLLGPIGQPVSIHQHAMFGSKMLAVHAHWFGSGVRCVACMPAQKC